MTDYAKTRVMLVDDHAIVRSGFRRLLERYPAIEVVAEAESGDHAYRGYFEHKPDVLVLDISMPDTSGLETMRRILARDAKAKIVFFSMHEDAAMAERAIRSGARGYITKSNVPEVLAKGVMEIAAGRIFMSADIAHSIAVFKLSGGNDPMSQLTEREFEVLKQLVSGRSTNDIASLLNLSGKTIANYHTTIKQKLGVATDMELVKVAMRHNLVN